MTNGTMMLLPPAPHLCQTCACDHAEAEPHNAQSLYYGMLLQMEEPPRAASWLTAMEHCDDATKARWTAALEDMGVDVAGGKIRPADAS